MSDIRTVWVDLAGDWTVTGPALSEDDGLETAIVLSLFTDRRAGPDEPLPGAQDDRRGWWADAFADVPGDRIGSWLWLLSREKQEQRVVVRAREYAAQALDWLVEDGVVRAVNVTAEIVRSGVLGLGIEVVRANEAAQKYQFATFWKGA